MSGSDITSFNWVQGAAPALVGPNRSRLRAVNVYGAVAGSFTLTNGNGGATAVTQKFPAGMNELYIPDNGMLFTEGVWVSAFTGAANELTIMLS
tara:strand:- start:372 stop:653 length:282 start_codon:yes stop_codon:yes gene_type:complete